MPAIATWKHVNDRNREKLAGRENVFTISARFH